MVLDPTVLDVIGDALITAWNVEERPDNVPALIESKGDQADPVPSMVFHLLEEMVVPMTGSLGDGRRLQFRPSPGPVVKCRGAFAFEFRSYMTDDPVRKLSQPSKAWLVRQLVNKRFGGLVHGSHYTGAEHEYKIRDRLYVRVVMSLVVDFQTRVDDATKTA